MQESLEILKTAIVGELKKAGHSVEDKDLFQTFTMENPNLFEQALTQLCEEGKLRVAHEKPVKDKVLDAVRDFLTPPMARKENQMCSLRMSEDERRQRAFEAAVDKGSSPTRRMLSIPSYAECLRR